MGRDIVLIVEGRTDKERLMEIIAEEMEIVCTRGTISHDLLEQWIELYTGAEVIVLVDSDRSGEQLRKQLKRAFPNASHLYVDKKYREVATTPYENLAMLLVSKNIEVAPQYLNRYGK